jgi:hypothetical protein
MAGSVVEARRFAMGRGGESDGRIVFVGELAAERLSGERCPENALAWRYGTE